MLQVTFTEDGFQVTGHAGYAEWGQDIVCAAVSALTQTTVLGLRDVVGLGDRLTEEVRAGFLTCRLPERLTAAERAQAKLLLATLRAGLIAIAQAYPGYLEILD